MTRLKKKKLEELTEAERETFDMVVRDRPVKPRDGHIGGPFDIWIRSPEMGRRLVGLGGFFRFKTSVDRRYIELVILATGSFWKAQFEWWAHEPMARDAGVPENIITALKNGETPTFDDPADEAAYNLANELQHTHELSKESYTAGVTHFEEQGVAELIALCGFYTMVSMTLNGFDVELPAGAEPPFEK